MTGYVHHIVDNDEDFPAAMLTFARGMGALIMLRDEGLDAKIPERQEPTDYHVKKLAEAEKALKAFEKLTPKARLAWAEDEKRRQIDYWRETLAKDEALHAKLSALLAKVSGWKPPTSDHRGLKQFAIEQLTMSLPNTSLWEEEIEKAKAKDAETMVKEHLAKLQRDVAYHEKENRDEVHRVEGRNKWVADLRASLKK